MCIYTCYITRVPTCGKLNAFCLSELSFSPGGCPMEHGEYPAKSLWLVPQGPEAAQRDRACALDLGHITGLLRCALCLNYCCHCVVRGSVCLPAQLDPRQPPGPAADAASVHSLHTERSHPPCRPLLQAVHPAAALPRARVCHPFVTNLPSVASLRPRANNDPLCPPAHSPYTSPPDLGPPVLGLHCLSRSHLSPLPALTSPGPSGSFRENLLSGGPSIPGLGHRYAGWRAATVGLFEVGVLSF